MMTVPMITLFGSIAIVHTIVFYLILRLMTREKKHDSPQKM